MGNDWIAGGTGNDTFVLVQRASMDIINPGSETIADFIQGEDKIALAAGLTFAQLNLSASGNDTLVKVGDELLATIQGIASSQISAGDFV